MWRSILRHFEFDYSDGYLFWDKAGQVARDLAEAFPGIQLRDQTLAQRDFHIPSTSFEIIYGIRVASLKSFDPDASHFREQVKIILEILAEDLELKRLTGYRFRFLLGWPCETREAANLLLHKLVPQEAKEKLTNLPEWEFQALQAELRSGSIYATSRHQIVDLPTPPASPANLSAPLVPYVTSSSLLECLEAVEFSAFNPVNVLEEIEKRVTAELLAKLSPEIHDPTTYD